MRKFIQINNKMFRKYNANNVFKGIIWFQVIHVKNIKLLKDV